MRTRTPSQFILILFILTSLLACGGGGGGSAPASAPAPAPAPAPGGGGSPAQAPAHNPGFVNTGRGAFCQTSLSPATNTPIAGMPDPLFGAQWYLARLNIDDAWAAGYDGTGIQIGIIDDGIEIAHEDLRGNVVDGVSLNFISFNNGVAADNPIPTTCDEGGAHGTAAAGIIAAEGDNGLGIKGIAYNSTIFGTNYFGILLDPNLRASLTRDMTDTAISVNSWGPDTATRIRSREDWDAIRTAVEAGVASGFGGKGISFVFSGGNSGNIHTNPHLSPLPPLQPGERERDPFIRTDGDFYGDLATYERHLNQPQIIPVCSVGSTGRVARYSTAGANLWICGASGTGAPLRSPITGRSLNELGVPTIDLTGTSGYNSGRPPSRAVCLGGDLGCWNFGGIGLVGLGPPKVPAPPLTTTSPGNYHSYFTGTTAAAPVVSGVIALIRDANPDLTWRDVKLILAETAEQVDSADTTGRPGTGDIGWQDVGSALGNSSNRYTHHHDYGFGLVDALAAVQLAEAGNWTLVNDLTANPISINEAYVQATGVTNFMIDDTNDEDITFIEYVQVDVRTNHSDFGTLTIELLSPDGTRSRLASPHDCLHYTTSSSGERTATDTAGCADLSTEFTFGSAAHLGETPIGEWALGILVNGAAIPAGAGTTPEDLTLRIFGHTRPSP